MEIVKIVQELNQEFCEKAEKKPHLQSKATGAKLLSLAWDFEHVIMLRSRLLVPTCSALLHEAVDRLLHC